MSIINNNADLREAITITKVSESNHLSKSIILYALEELTEKVQPNIYLLEISQLFFIAAKTCQTLGSIDTSIDTKANVFLAMIEQYIFDYIFLNEHEGKTYNGKECEAYGWKEVCQSEILALKCQAQLKQYPSKIEKRHNGTFAVIVYKNDYLIAKYERGVRGLEY